MINITLNTWGLGSINNNTFNVRYNRDYTYPKKARDVIYLSMKVTFIALDILGYIPGVSVFSGITRMTIGAGICAVTIAIGDRNAEEGTIIQHWYDEALVTGVAQIARGALEAFVPYGWAFNAGLDLMGTEINIIQCCARGLEDRAYYYGPDPHLDPCCC